MPARWSYYAEHPAHRRLRPAARAFVDWIVEEARDGSAG
jgi:DNA-binding transcriptional LysR family regulator